MSTHDDNLYRSFVTKTFTRRDLLKGMAVVGAGATLAPVIAACGGGSTSTSPSATAASPTTGGSLRVGVLGGSANETLDAQAPAPNMPAMMFHYQLYDSLLDFAPDGTLVAALAESWEPNADATQFTVKLKPDLMFSNGKSITADDVIYSFERIVNPKAPGLGASQLIGLKPGGAKKIDNLTVQFNLTQANAVFPDALGSYACAIVPMDYKPVGMKGAIGSGPFKITVFKAGTGATFVRNENYWGEGPFLDQLVVKEFADATARLNALLDGSVDYVPNVPNAQIKIAEGQGGFGRLDSKTGMWIPFTMNLNTKPFNDVKVRQAFRLIADRQQLIDQASGGLAWVGNDMYSPFDPGYPKDLPQRTQDLEQAKSLLKQAGYDNNLAVTLITSSANSDVAAAASTVYAEQAKGAGVTVNVKNVDSNTFWGDMYTKWPFAFDLWGTRNYLLQAAMGTLPTAPYNETHFDKYYPNWVKIVDEAFKTADDAKRNELVGEASTIEYNEGGNLIWSFTTIADLHVEKAAGAVADFSGLSGCANRSRFNTVHFS